MSVTLGITPEVLAGLGLPAREELDDQRQRGAACVWCAGVLDAESAVDLGEQPPPARWFPRACQSCVTGRAWRGFLDHAMPCARCGGASGVLCETGRALSRLARGRRL
ncbi:hypothetical protein [Streptomyces sp. bgisy154]|uniref:hypothetical protein n=1 Tax=Streptomyces sp. bgisy154 TaxID=3413794 RepID=UPI003D74EA0F